MENRKDIGKAISEKLRTLDKTPSDQLWNDISYELLNKKKRRIGLFFFWTKIIALIIAGSIAVLSVYNQYSGANLFPSNKSRETITVGNVNGETVAPKSNGNNTKNAESNNQESNKKAGKENNNIVNRGETKTNNSNTIENNNTVNINIENNKTNLKNTNEGNGFIKSTRKGNFNTAQSNSKAGKNSKAKYSKNGKRNFKKKKTNNSLYRNHVTKNTDLNALQDKSASESNSGTAKNAFLKDLIAVENKKISKKDSIISQRQKEKKTKLKAMDSLIAQKQKDNEITTNMYPIDSIKKDSIKIYKKVQVDAFVSPTLSGYLSEGSTIDRRLDPLSKKSEIKFSYGFGLTYELTKRLSVRMGCRKINLTYVTKNAPIDTDNYRGIAYNVNTSNQTILATFNALPAGIIGPTVMDITQKISYVEIPLEVKYNFLSNKVGLKSSLGFSYLLLDENKVYISTLNGLNQNIGTTRNLSNTSISATVGIEVDYPLFKNTKIFAEPLLNYQIKSFSDGNYKPYIFGIHTGIRYSFNNK